MKRDELIKKLQNLPTNVNVFIQHPYEVFCSEIIDVKEIDMNLKEEEGGEILSTEKTAMLIYEEF
tara:strand:+ start:946 stop:1140 length:195 start_codon:yes stop_codon:yes gene_type:complete